MARRIELTEDISLEQASTFQLSSLDDFIISFERLSKQRILDIIEDYGDEIMEMVLKILMVDPGGYNITKDVKIIPRSDSDILRNVKGVNKLYDTFTTLYEKIIASYEKVAQEQAQDTKQDIVDASDNTIMQNNIGVEEANVTNEMLNIAGINTDYNRMESIKITKTKRMNDGKTISVVVNNIDEYKNLLELEDVLCEKLNIANTDPNFIYESINKKKYNANDADAHKLSKKGKLSGLVEVFIPAGTVSNASDDDLLETIVYETEIQKRIIDNCDSKPVVEQYLREFCEEFDICLSDKKFKSVLKETTDIIRPFEDMFNEKNLINSGINTDSYEINTAQKVFENFKTLKQYFKIIENNTYGSPKELWNANPIMLGETLGKSVKLSVLYDGKNNIEVIMKQDNIISENLKQLDNAVRNAKIGNYLGAIGITETEFADYNDLKYAVKEALNKKSLTGLHKAYYKTIYENLDRNIDSDDLQTTLIECMNDVTSRGFVEIYQTITGKTIKQTDLFYESTDIMKQQILRSFKTMPKRLQEDKINYLVNKLY